MKSLQKYRDKGDLEWSEVFKGALLKVEPLPRVSVGRVLGGNALVQTGQKIESQGWTGVFSHNYL